jgi:tetratricopeptide (TPR) repeat protein
MLEIIEKIKIPLIIAFLTFIGSIFYKNRMVILLGLKRLFFRILPINFNIAFSLDFNEGLNSGNYYDQLKKNIIKSINEANLNNYIKIKDCSLLKKFENKVEAESFRQEKNIDLIIWGGFTNDNLKVKGEVINKINLSFTFGYPGQKDDKLGKLLNLDIQSKFAQKNYWEIFENNSFNDIEIISTNIFNLSSYILAITLKLYGKVDKSLKIIEHLFFTLKKNDKQLCSKIEPHLINCYEILALEFAFKKLDFEKSIEFCNKILQLRPKSFFALSNLAVFYYKSGNRSESTKYVNLLKKTYPNNTITTIDLAFIKILEKDYIGAYSMYLRLIKNKVIQFNPQEVVEFLSFEYEKSEEPALLFASGILSFYYGDKEIAKNDLELFVKKAKSGDHKLMINKSKEVLKKYSN